MGTAVAGYFSTYTVKLNYFMDQKFIINALKMKETADFSAALRLNN